MVLFEPPERDLGGRMTGLSDAMDGVVGATGGGLLVGVEIAGGMPLAKGPEMFLMDTIGDGPEEGEADTKQGEGE